MARSQDAKFGDLFEKFPPVLQLHLKRFEYDFEHDTRLKVPPCPPLPLATFRMPGGGSRLRLHRQLNRALHTAGGGLPFAPPDLAAAFFGERRDAPRDVTSNCPFPGLQLVYLLFNWGLHFTCILYK